MTRSSVKSALNSVQQRGFDSRNAPSSRSYHNKLKSASKLLSNKISNFYPEPYSKEVLWQSKSAIRDGEERLLLNFGEDGIESCLSDPR